MPSSGYATCCLWQIIIALYNASTCSLFHVMAYVQLGIPRAIEIKTDVLAIFHAASPRPLLAHLSFHVSRPMTQALLLSLSCANVPFISFLPLTTTFRYIYTLLFLMSMLPGPIVNVFLFFPAFPFFTISHRCLSPIPQLGSAQLISWDFASSTCLRLFSLLAIREQHKVSFNFFTLGAMARKLTDTQ